MEKAPYWLQYVRAMSLKSSQDTTKEGQYFPERVKFRVSDS